MTRLLPLLMALLLLPGCFFQKQKDGLPTELARVSEIEVGKTTRAQVLEMLGSPRSIVKLNEGEAYVFEHRIQKNTGAFFILIATHRGDTQRDAVTVVVDGKGVVAAVGSSFDAEESSFGTPWGD